MSDADKFGDAASGRLANVIVSSQWQPAFETFYHSNFMLLLRRYGFGIFSAITPLSVFLATVASEPASWDTAEIQGVPYILGIAHPTGFPLFTLVGYAFSHIFAFGSVALRMNILSAVCVTIAAVVFYLVAVDLRVPKVSAAAACFWFSVVLPVWKHATRAEVHDMALMFAAFTVLFLLRWLSHRRDTDLILAALALGLGLATHPLMVWLLPGFVLTLAFAPPPLRLGIRCIAFLCAPVGLYLYLPLRSIILVATHGDPTLGLQGVHGGLFWNYNNPSTWSGFVAEITGSQFAAGGSALSAFVPTTLQGFLWNFLTSLDTAFGAFSLILAAIGVVRLWSEGWNRCLAFLALTLCIVPFSYGYGVEGDAERYRLLCYAAFTIFMACAALPRGGDRMPLVRTAVVTALMLLWGGETMWNNALRLRIALIAAHARL